MVSRVPRGPPPQSPLLSQHTNRRDCEEMRYQVSALAGFREAGGRPTNCGLLSRFGGGLSVACRAPRALKPAALPPPWFKRR